VVAQPLLQVADVVADLHALGPVAEVLAQQQRVERGRANEVEELPEDLTDDLGVGAVQRQRSMHKAQLV